MPSMAQPMGSIPDKGAKDVNPASNPSVEEEQVLETKTPADEVEESDLKALEDQKKVPYNRFKEKVDEANSLKEQLKELGKRSEENTRRLIEEAELRLRVQSSAKEPEEDLDPYESKIRETQKELSVMRTQLASLKHKADTQALESQLTSLKTKYPEADDIAVLGWTKVKQGKGEDVDLEELMEKSHNRQLERVETKMREIVEHKRAAIKKAVPTREGGIRLKESERPKSIKEANALLRKMLG